MSNSWIQTYTIQKFFPLNPNPENIFIEDIAHALSMQCRFSGHVRYFYSVAEHSVHVSNICKPEFAKHALLHDASEAYLVDIPKPLKDSGQFESYKQAEFILQNMIYKKFGLNEEEPANVKEADVKMLATEAKFLFSSFHPDWKLPVEPLKDFEIKAYYPEYAKQAFLNRFYELFGY